MSKQLESMQSILRERYIYEGTMNNAEMDCYNRLVPSEQMELDKWDQHGKVPHGVFAE